MKNYNNEKELRRLMKQRKKIVPSEETKEKSLQAFQRGLSEITTATGKESKFQKYRQPLLFSIAAATAAGITGLLIVSADISQDGSPFAPANVDSEENSVENEPENTDRQEPEPQQERENESQNADTSLLNELEVDEELKQRVLNRPEINIDEKNAQEYHENPEMELHITIPNEWTFKNEVNPSVKKMDITGPEGENMRMLLFGHEVEDDIFTKQLEDTISDITYTEATRVPFNMEFINYIRETQHLRGLYKNILPFDTENTEIYMFVDEETDRLYELYITELFGLPMIFTADFSLDNRQNWSFSWLFLSQVYPLNSPYIVPGSEGELHPEFGRPTEQKAIITPGSIYYDEVELELYINEELGYTSYLTKNTEIEKVENEFLLGFKYSDPDVSAKSYYSFGKLKDGFPFEQAEEILYDIFNIDIAYAEYYERSHPYSYSYVSHMDEEFYDGHFELYEEDGNWFFTHKHGDREDYNGGVFYPRLETLTSLMKWH